MREYSLPYAFPYQIREYNSIRLFVETNVEESTDDQRVTQYGNEHVQREEESDQSRKEWIIVRVNERLLVRMTAKTVEGAFSENTDWSDLWLVNVMRV